MSLFSEHERKVLRKFKKPSIVTDADTTVLNRWAIGFVSYGFDYDTDEETAKLTESGLWHLKEDEKRST